MDSGRIAPDGNRRSNLRAGKNGVELCSDIAEELGISKALVSWHAKKLIDQCYIKKIGQKYVLFHDSVP
ncbi:MAG: transcriptional regulator [Puniceicoccales bacterium]|nr:transcriptional regulator [Puniceicoccales bacterium]